MKYSLVREVKEPNRAHQTDAGIDFYVPVFDEKFKQDIKSKNELNYGGLYFDGDSDNEYICIAPGYRILIPSGVHVNVPHGYALIAFNKSGVASKKGLITGAAVVDVGYQGQVHINVINSGKSVQHINQNEKLVQFILVKIGSELPERVEFEELYQKDSTRGAGGFGSTDHK